jgi:hypothetical protein
MRDSEPVPVRIEVAESMVNHLATSGEALATPGDPVAKLRREVLRGLRAPR